MTNELTDKNNEYFPCAHCQGSGSCSSGKNADSCKVCLTESKVDVSTPGVVCSVCGGIGIAEMKTGRINRRAASLLAMLIVYFALFLVFFMAVTNNQYFTEILAFSSTLIGAITGYYFAGKRQ